MQPASRLHYTGKAAILWVHIATALSLVPSVLGLNSATFELAWVGAALGLLGALSHALIALLAPPYVFASFRRMALAVSILSAAVAAASAYALAGLAYLHPSTMLQREVLTSAVVVMGFMVSCSLAVTYFMRRKSAA